jgi:WD40 repeat protein
MRSLSRLLAVLTLFSSLPSLHADDPPAQVDRRGDPLPAGALARLGTTRFRHGVSAQAVALSPDGKLLASAGADAFIRVWDTGNGRQVQAIENSTAGNLRQLRFAPDSKKLVGLPYFQGPVAWDLSTGRVAWTAPERCQAHTLEWSADGQYLAGGCTDAKVRLWDARTGKLARELTGANSALGPVGFTADGKEVRSVGIDNVLRRWETETGKLLGQTPLPGVNKPLSTLQAASMLAFSPDGKWLALGRQAEPALELWTCEPAAAPRRFEHSPPLSHCQFVAFSPDSRFLAQIAGAGQLGVWGVASGRELRSFSVGSSVIGGMALSSGGRLLAHAGGSPAVHLWDLSDGRAIHPEEEAEQGIYHIVLLRDRKTLVTADLYGVLRAWDTTTGKLLDRFAERPSTLAGLMLTPDGKGVLGYGGTGQRTTWRPGQPARIDPPPGNVPFTQARALSPDGKTLTVIGPGTVRRFDLDARTELASWPGLQTATNFAYFTPCGQWLLAGGFSSDLECWDATTGRIIKTAIRLTHSPGLSRDGHTLAVSTPAEVRLMEVGIWQERARVPTPGAGFIHTEALSPDGDLLACGTSRGDLLIYEVTTGKQLTRLTGHRGPVRTLDFSLDGALLISGSEDTTVLVWDATRLRPAPLPPARLSAAEKARLCEDLGATDPGKAYRAIRALTGTTDFADSLRKLLALQTEPPAKRIPKLIAQLDDDDFDQREKAAQELALYGREAEPALREALKSPLAQVKRSAGEILAQLKDGLPPRQLRDFRVLEVLERANTAEARKLLAELAAGDADAWVTKQARLAQQRLEAR